MLKFINRLFGRYRVMELREREKLGEINLLGEKNYITLNEWEELKKKQFKQNKIKEKQREEDAKKIKIPKFSKGQVLQHKLGDKVLVLYPLITFAGFLERDTKQWLDMSRKDPESSNFDGYRVRLTDGTLVDVEEWELQEI